MKRFVLVIATAGLLGSIPHLGEAAGPFDQRLTQEQQIEQALNRLTFGARPGDVQEVRRLGVAKWIELQLHPERIPENPALEAKLKPLETLRMDLPEIVKQYTPPAQAVMMQQRMAFMNNQLPPEDMRKVMTGTAEERTAVLKALNPDKRTQVLAFPRHWVCQRYFCLVLDLVYFRAVYPRADPFCCLHQSSRPSDGAPALGTDIQLRDRLHRRRRGGSVYLVDCKRAIATWAYWAT